MAAFNIKTNAITNSTIPSSDNANDSTFLPNYEPLEYTHRISPIGSATTAAIRAWIAQWFHERDTLITDLHLCLARLAWNGRWVENQPSDRLEADLVSWGFGPVYSRMIVADLEALKVSFSIFYFILLFFFFWPGGFSLEGGWSCGV
jgi:hypothetical protein